MYIYPYLFGILLNLLYLFLYSVRNISTAFIWTRKRRYFSISRDSGHIISIYFTNCVPILQTGSSRNTDKNSNILTISPPSPSKLTIMSTVECNSAQLLAIAIALNQCTSLKLIDIYFIYLLAGIAGITLDQ